MTRKISFALISDLSAYIKFGDSFTENGNCEILFVVKVVCNVTVTNKFMETCNK